MRLLLDTHVLLWLITDSPRIREIKPYIEDVTNEVYFSAASIWEISIKYSLGKIPISPEDAKEEFINAGFAELKISADHAITVNTIESADPEHKDPFDRLLIAQAKKEQLMLVTADEKIAAYEESCVWKI